ncbi:hypothetical protein ACVBEG_27635 [Pseudomonas sp. GG8]
MINNLVLQLPLGVDPLLKAFVIDLTRLASTRIGIATTWIMFSSTLISYLLAPICCCRWS